ncbi:MAG TPA: DUF4124 domain-containing protein [Noviherbaspirillum sp.]|uniref:DUF4124 domain-containing protein n=1 Tax=Noviherbaspirillum sp. TaxID=1926288 RepID=UPI002B49C7C7|nr:DUF4124 domain-containing protein [Noviherbaspirillum sp.]HJV85607.1 DUF4124 domain-containing protein [Noviherbaspirillum sp.]
MKKSLVRQVLLFIAVLSCAAPAFAIYKCESDGSVRYSDMPCPDAKVLNIRGVAPADAADAHQQALQDRKKLKQLEDARHKSERQEDKERRSAARAQAAAHKACTRLALHKKWADEDAASATGKSAATAKRKARRAEERYQTECGKIG